MTADTTTTRSTAGRLRADVPACIAVTYSPGDTLASFIDSMRGEGFPPGRVLLVDNGSTDGAPEAAAAADEHVELLRSGGNVGYGTAVNIGERTLPDEVEWFLVCNPDTQAEPGAIAALLDAAAAHPDAGVLGPRILDPDGTVYPSARALPSIRTGIGHAVLSGVWPTNPWTRRYQQRDVSSASATIPVGWLSGAFLLVRRAAFAAVGGFDEGYFMYFEDVDLGRRMAEAGWRNLFVPAASVRHIGGASTSAHSGRMLRVHHASAYRYVATTHPGVIWAPVRLAIRVGLDIRARWKTRRP